MRKRYRLSVLFLSLVLTSAGVGTLRADDTVPRLLKDRLFANSDIVRRPADRDAMATFYAQRGFAPAWLYGAWLSPKAQQVIKELRVAEDWGLAGADFALTALASVGANEPYSSEDIASIEYEISAAILRYALQARGGRIGDPAKMLSEFIDRQPQLPEPLAVLRNVSASSDPAAELRSYHPKHPQFARLREAYLSARAALQPHRATPINAQGPFLTPGMKHADVAALREMLSVPAKAGAADIYDAPLQAAVKRFQRENGLSADGLTGPATRQALHGRSRVLRDLLANMEAWRWMPDDLGAKHLFVNIPAFSLKLIDAGATTLEERVIVGKVETQTPVFSRALSRIVLNPTWLMPDSIKREKLVAAEKSGRSVEDEGYVVKKGNRVVNSSDIDWNDVDIRQYSFYQPAGDRNALGDVKFLFPNKFSVYLHDTPSKSLFAGDFRAYSHGCVRLRNPLALAQNLLREDGVHGKIDVKKLLRTSADSADFVLSNPVPVHIAYFTQWINEDGSRSDFADVYGHTERVGLMLEAIGAGKRDPHALSLMAALDENAGTPTNPTFAMPAKPNEGRAIEEFQEARRGGGRVAASYLGAAPPSRPKNLVQKTASKGASRRPSVGDLMNAAFRN